MKINRNLMLVVLIVLLSCDKNNDIVKINYKNKYCDLTNTNFDYDNFSNFIKNKDSLITNNQIPIRKYLFDENLLFIPGVDFTILKSDLFIVNNYSDKFIAKYDSTGKFIMKISEIGQGPNEISSPHLLGNIGDTLLIYDYATTSIKYFLKNGDFINEIKTPEIMFPDDYEIYKNKIILYYSIRPNVATIKIYNLLSNDISEIEDSKKNNCLINMASDRSVIDGLTVNEKGYLLTLKPQEYGIFVYSPEGKYLGNLTNFNKPYYFKEAPKNKLKSSDFQNTQKLKKIYFNYSRCRWIHYIGNNIVLLEIENPKNSPKNLKETFPLYIEFWRIDGKFLGSLKTDKRIVKAEDGKLYFWKTITEKSKNNTYPNPILYEYDIINDFFRWCAINEN